MFDDRRSFITRAFLRAEFDLDFRAYAAERDVEILQKLRDWDGRLRLNETQAEGAFTQTFFVDIWGYAARAYTMAWTRRNPLKYRKSRRGWLEKIR